ncbi:unnamed protein product, partial [Polarella glacialis]
RCRDEAHWVVFAGSCCAVQFRAFLGVAAGSSGPPVHQPFRSRQVCSLWRGRGAGSATTGLAGRPGA